LGQGHPYAMQNWRQETQAIPLLPPEFRRAGPLPSVIHIGEQRPPPQHENNILQTLLHQTLLTHHPHVQGNGGHQLTALSASDAIPADTNCLICLCNPTESQEPWSRMPCCRIYMHLTCAKTHLQNDRRCPQCRKDIL